MVLNTLKKQTERIEKERLLSSFELIIKNADKFELEYFEELIKKRKSELSN